MNRAVRQKIVFWTTAAATFGLLAVLWVFLLYGPHRWFGVSLDQSHNIVQWSLSFWLAAIVVAGGVCKGTGLSDAGKTVEILRRPSTGFAQALLRHSPQAQVRCPRLFWFALSAVFCLVAVLLGLLPLMPDTAVTPGSELSCYCVGAFFGVVSLFCAWLPFGNGRFIGQISRDGVTYHNVFTNHVALWESIGECEIITIRDVFGKATICIRLKNNAGGTLLNFRLSPGTEEEQIRFVQALREPFQRA